jgi:glutathione S-transferase
MLTLYFAPGSSSMAPHIALNEIGCAFEARPTSFHAHAMRQADYLAINPVGQVPTLMIDGRPLTEVAAILYYLAKAYPEAGLLPDDLEGEAQAVSWMSYCAATLHPARRGGLAAAMDIWGAAVGDSVIGGGWSGDTRWPTSTCFACSGASTRR